MGDIRLIDFGECMFFFSFFFFVQSFPKHFSLPKADESSAFIGAKRGVNTHIYNTPPELIEDEEATCKADIWSLGCIVSSFSVCIKWN